MPDHVYEVVAAGARYWFLFWMALIVWRSWRWYRKDRRAARKRLKLLPDAGFVGEMVVVDGGSLFENGTVFPVPREGTLGMLRTNDLCVPAKGVDRRHLWFRYEDRKGLMVGTFGKNKAEVDGVQAAQSRRPVYMAHGSWLTVGDVQLRLRLFAGFESEAHAPRRAMAMPDAPMYHRPQPMPDEQPERPDTPDTQPAPMDEQQAQQYQQYQQFLQWQQWQAQQQAYAQQQQPAYQPWQEQPYEPQPEELYEEPYEEMYEEPDSLPYDMAQIAREEGLVDNSIFMRPAGQQRSYVQEEPAEAHAEEQPVFYAPETDEEPDDAYEEDWYADPDEDMTDAAAPPRSAYVGRDEAERAKRAVWDKYFGGGAKQ